MDKKVLKSNAALLLAAMIWGLAFVAQSDGMNYIGPFTFGATRCFLGSAVLVPVYLIMQKKSGLLHDESAKETRKFTFKVGLLCGAILFGATSTQQIGLQYTAAGKAGFVTALYIVLVPVFGMIIFKKKASWKTWISVVIATVGLYLLCIKEGFSIDRGDVWVIACAVIFTFHILVVDKFGDRVDGVLLSIVQFAVVSLLSVPFIFINKEAVSFSAVSSAWVSILYTGILSSGVGYTLQIIGQKDAKNPAIASLLMSMESVFAVIFGWLILHERLSAKEFAGVILMSAAIVLSQLPVGLKKSNAEDEAVA